MSIVLKQILSNLIIQIAAFGGRNGPCRVGLLEHGSFLIKREKKKVRKKGEVGKEVCGNLEI